jgi:hypothetical protein
MLTVAADHSLNRWRTVCAVIAGRKVAAQIYSLKVVLLDELIPLLRLINLTRL